MGLQALRAELADELTEAGLDTYAYEPDAFTAPGALVAWGSPSIEAADTFTDVRCRFYLYVLADDEQELDKWVSLAISTLSHDYDIERIEISPQLENGRLSGAEITLTTEVARKEII